MPVLVSRTQMHVRLVYGVSVLVVSSGCAVPGGWRGAGRGGVPGGGAGVV